MIERTNLREESIAALAAVLNPEHKLLLSWILQDLNIVSDRGEIAGVLETNELRSDLDDAENEVQELRAEIIDRDKRIVELREELAELEQDIRVRQFAATTDAETIQELRETCARREEARQNLQNMNADLQAKLDVATGIASKLTYQLNTIEPEYIRLRATLKNNEKTELETEPPSPGRAEVLGAGEPGNAGAVPPDEAPITHREPEADRVPAASAKPVATPAVLTSDIISSNAAREIPPHHEVIHNRAPVKPLPPVPDLPPTVTPWTAEYSPAQLLMVLQVYADGGDFHLAASKATTVGKATVTEGQARLICANYHAKHAEYLRELKIRGEEALYHKHLGLLHGYFQKREQLAKELR